MCLLLVQRRPSIANEIMGCLVPIGVGVGIAIDIDIGIAIDPDPDPDPDNDNDNDPKAAGGDVVCET
jgi:hypothetical protein